MLLPFCNASFAGVLKARRHCLARAVRGLPPISIIASRSDVADALLHSLALVQAELVFLERQIADLQHRVEIVRAHEGDILDRLSVVQC